tara:strand:+ start:107 stop:499 length:393 start_codon:yes stop_codon:yes gene_type:complete
MKYLCLLALIVLTCCTTSVSAKEKLYAADGYIIYPEEKPSQVIIQLKLKPNSGWKWNNTYPYKIFVKNSEKTLNKHFEEKDKSFVASFLLQRPKKESIVEVVANFSICSSTTCNVLRNQKFQYKILGTNY